MSAIHEPITQAVGQTASAPAHPDEIRANVELRLGKHRPDREEQKHPLFHCDS
jgi:hypothetical protein